MKGNEQLFGNAAKRSPSRSRREGHDAVFRWGEVFPQGKGADGRYLPTWDRGVTLAPAEQDGAERTASGDVLVGCFFLSRQQRGATIPTR
jgi:hypothetical protein